MRLSGAVVWITGGARGIGFATAEAMAAKGAKVAIGDINAEAAKEAAGRLPSGFGGGLDVRDRASWASFRDAATEALGPVDVLINNAGVMLIGPLEDESDEAIRRQLDVNVYGPLLGAQTVLPALRARGGGHIVNVGSMAGLQPVAGGVTYCATKFGVAGMTRSLALELAPQGIGVTLVLPSVVNTALAQGVPAGRGVKILEPSDVAAEIVSAIENGDEEITVPRWGAPMARVVSAMPPSVQKLVAKAFGADDLFMRARHDVRSAYRGGALEGSDAPEG